MSRFWLGLGAAAVGGLLVVAGLFAFAQRLGDIDRDPEPTPALWAAWIAGGLLLLGGMWVGEAGLVQKCPQCGRRLRRGRTCVCQKVAPDLPP